MLADGVGAILLVPEIALTPQMIARVRARFGERVGVLHSGLATGERVREYRRIARGEAPVVVGARSAVFAPVTAAPADHRRRGSRQFVQAGGGASLPRAHGGRDASGGDRAACCSRAAPRLPRRVIGRPTEGRVRLLRRAAGDDARPAKWSTCAARAAASCCAPLCREALAETLRAGEQAIVLLNRRGYAGHVHCDLCGHVMMCADCELSLTYHSRERRLVCHHCGRAYVTAAAVPGMRRRRRSPGAIRAPSGSTGSCGRWCPTSKVFRLDSDVLTSGTRVHALLDAFAAARPAVLVGTQMVAKGHDFGDVTLVVVADADTGLYMPDFRAAERTFQLLTQVAGRAGRAEQAGAGAGANLESRCALY